MHIAALVTRSQSIEYTESEENGGYIRQQNGAEKCALLDDTSEESTRMSRPTKELFVKRAIAVGAVLLIFILGVIFRVATKPAIATHPTLSSTVGHTYNSSAILVNGTDSIYSNAILKHSSYGA